MAASNTLLDAIPHPVAEQPEVEYPYSDGKVLMETEPHARSIVAMRYQLESHFMARTDAYVAGSMAVYYRQGDPTAVVVPDVFVVLGAPQKEWRKSYRIWDEGGVMPNFVVEVASESTSRRDATTKLATYERMGVREYWRFDPLGALIPGRLAGWRLEGGRYQPVRAVRAAGWHRSEELDLELRAERWLLRFHDPLLGRDLPIHTEADAAQERSERAREEAERRAKAEAVERQRAEREREEAERRAETEATERLRAERERDRAEREREEANQRIRELEARLRLSDNPG